MGIWELQVALFSLPCQLSVRKILSAEGRDEPDAEGEPTSWIMSGAPGCLLWAFSEASCFLTWGSGDTPGFSPCVPSSCFLN